MVPVRQRTDASQIQTQRRGSNMDAIMKQMTMRKIAMTASKGGKKKPAMKADSSDSNESSADSDEDSP